MRLADTSAWTWSRRLVGAAREEFERHALDARLATCAIVKLELLYSVRSHREFAQRRIELDELDEHSTGQAAWDRALDVYGLLAAQGGSHQRAVGHADLLIAATAELAGVPVLHYDEDYDRIAAVTGQPTEWLAPRGSL